jgi:acetylcholinesterase
MGDSAGGSSILYHMTAYGGLGDPAPFQQALPQSPAFWPVVSNEQQEAAFQKFLQLANATSLADLRTASSTNLIQANVQDADRFSPIVNGEVVRTLPGQLLARGLYSKNVKSVMVGHNFDEGLLFVNIAAQNTSAVNAHIASLLPDASTAVLGNIENELYPAVYNNPYRGYNDSSSRQAEFPADLNIVCNAYYLLKAFGFNNSYPLFLRRVARCPLREYPVHILQRSRAGQVWLR